MKRFSLVLIVTVCDFSRGSGVFMILIVRPFLPLMSDSTSIRDPRHFHFFHKSYSSGILSSSLFDSFPLRFFFFSRCGASLFTRFILVLSVLIKLMPSAYFGSITTWCGSLSMSQSSSDHKILFPKSSLVGKPAIISMNWARWNMKKRAERQSSCATPIF